MVFNILLSMRIVRRKERDPAIFERPPGPSDIQRRDILFMLPRCVIMRRERVDEPISGLVVETNDGGLIRNSHHRESQQAGRAGQQHAELRSAEWERAGTHRGALSGVERAPLQSMNDGSDRNRPNSQGPPSRMSTDSGGVRGDLDSADELASSVG